MYSCIGAVHCSEQVLQNCSSSRGLWARRSSRGDRHPVYSPFFFCFQVLRWEATAHTGKEGGLKDGRARCPRRAARRRPRARSLKPRVSLPRKRMTLSHVQCFADEQLSDSARWQPAPPLSLTPRRSFVPLGPCWRQFARGQPSWSTPHSKDNTHAHRHACTHAHSHTHAHSYVAAEVCKPFGFMANDMVITPLGVEITIIGVKMPPAREPAPGDPDADADAEQDEEGEHAEGAEPRGNGVVCCVSSLLLASSLVSPRPSLPLGKRVRGQWCPNMKRTD